MHDQSVIVDEGQESRERDALDLDSCFGEIQISGFGSGF